MIESGQTRWMSECREELPEPRFRFSLATIMRCTFVACGFLGFLVSLTVTEPQTVFLVLFAVGCVLGGIVFWRRRGTAWQRGLALAGVFANSLLVALYCSTLSTELQTELDSLDTWGGLDSTFTLIVVILGAPAIGVVIVLMLRAWMWSAHDVVISRIP